MSLDNLVVGLKCTPFTLQRLYLPGTLHGQESGRYAIVELSDSSTFICRICHQELLQNDCCLLEKSVQCSLSISLSDVPVRLSKVIVIPVVKPVRSMRVSVILSRIEDIRIWKEKNLTYLSLLKQLLQLFIVNTGCSINLQNFVAAKKLGVRAVCVSDIGIQHPGRVTSFTKVAVKEILSWERYSLRHVREKIEIAGNNAAYERLKKFVKSRSSLRGNALATNYDFSQLMIIGPSGSGKKTLIKKVAQDCGAVLVQLDCTRLMRPKPGDSEAIIRETFEHSKLLAEEGLIILLLLHTETICSKPGRILNQVNDLLDSVARLPNLIVATTCSDPTLIHESAKSASRFNNVVFLGVPSESERLEMLKLLGKEDIYLAHDKWCDLAKMTPGCVLADLALILNQARRELSNNVDSHLSEDRAFSCLKSAVASTEPSAVRGELGLVKANSSIHQIGGLQEIKDSLIQFVQWPLVHSDAFKRMNIRHSSGILLYGPPGCAKTSLARAVAAENDVTFLSVSAADLYSPYVGDTERTISALFQRARAAAPTLLFIDEIDALVGSRQGTQKKAQERVLSSFLVEMDGVGVNAETEFSVNPSESKIVILAATNRPHVIDGALLRPGRLDKLIYVPPPNREDRLDILRVLTKKMPLDESVNLPDLSENTELFSGADLANLCREAAFHSMTSRGVNTTRISQQDFLTALKSSCPSLTADQVDWSSSMNSRLTWTGSCSGPYEDLREAIREKDEEKIKDLLRKGVKVNDNGRVGEDAPLHLAIKYEASADIIKLLLSKGADVACEDEYGEMPLMLATERKNVDVVKMIIDHGADVYIADAEGSTPLHRAAYLGCEDLVELFLREQLFVDIEDGLHYTPLHLATKAGHSSVVKLLLAHGANLHEVDRHGRTALHHAALGGHNEIACRLIDYEADVNVRDHKGRTCLHDAAWLGHANVVQIILNFNANINVVDSDGFTALHHAATRGHEDVIFLLLERGADLSIPDNGGRTPLHHVILRGNYDMIKMLIECSDDLNTRDYENLTPIASILSGMFSTTIFQFNHDPELCELLIKHIVRVTMTETKASVNADEFLGVKEHLSDDKWAEVCLYIAKCVEEVKKIKNFKASDDSISLYDFLTKKSSTLVQYSKNEDSGTILNFTEWDKEFPIYSSFMKARIRKAVKKRDMQRMAARCLSRIVHQSLPWVQRFPDVPSDIILKDMNELDLRNLMKACFHSPG